VNFAPEDGDLADVLELLGNPDAVTVASLIEKANPETADWLLDRRNRRALPHRLERCGYTSVRNPDASDGRWRVGTQGKKQIVYAHNDQTTDQQMAAARKLKT
jgi:hypothetical protein